MTTYLNLTIEDTDIFMNGNNFALKTVDQTVITFTPEAMKRIAEYYDKIIAIQNRKNNVT